MLEITQTIYVLPVQSFLAPTDFLSYHTHSVARPVTKSEKQCFSAMKRDGLGLLSGEGVSSLYIPTWLVEFAGITIIL